MSGSIARAVACLLVAPFLSLASALAPPHAHEPSGDHRHLVTHTHFEPHHAHADDGDADEVEQDHERVIWLTDAIVHQSPYQLIPSLAILPASFDTIPVTAFVSIPRREDGASAHGPPRHSTPDRAPPCLSA